ncbi:MAG: DUF1045 domain-containing protein [Desulfovibrio sp.]|uniref:DUF1045 domain-containing protein n=1 Tax=Desulfovibrio sp. TaxID=885 RepID=UPI002A371C79|nr:DUF1045 domain-containing protein [Desulfovibrio sp.]MDY0259442.1 DUF1045 domain-containing protein [Desulfovibrio sp.]
MQYRYAVYYVPEQHSPLYAAGSALLGYDARTGQSVPTPCLPLPRDLPHDLPHDLSWESLVAEPTRYGLHATVVAPFFPLHSSEDALADTLRLFCQRMAAVLTPLRVVEHRGFLALMPDVPGVPNATNVPDAPGVTSAPDASDKAGTSGEADAPGSANVSGRRAMAALRHMAGEATRVFAPLRRPAPEAETLRRAKGLTNRQLAFLRTWGYPYVFEEYDFHISLTGPSTASPALGKVVAAYLADSIAQPQNVASLSLCRQPVDENHEPGKPCTGRFRVLESFPLSSTGIEQ